MSRHKALSGEGPKCSRQPTSVPPDDRDPFAGLRGAQSPLFRFFEVLACQPYPYSYRTTWSPV